MVDIISKAADSVEKIAGDAAFLFWRGTCWVSMVFDAVSVGLRQAEFYSTTNPFAATLRPNKTSLYASTSAVGYNARRTGSNVFMNRRPLTLCGRRVSKWDWLWNKTLLTKSSYRVRIPCLTHMYRVKIESSHHQQFFNAVGCLELCRPIDGLLIWQATADPEKSRRHCNSSSLLTATTYHYTQTHAAISRKAII